MCHITRSCVWCDSLARQANQECGLCDTHCCSCVWHSFICVIWLIHMCDIPRRFMWHDSIVPKVNQKAQALLQYTLLCDLRLVCTCYMTCSYVWCDSLARKAYQKAWAVAIHSDVNVCDMTRSNVWCDSFMCDMLQSQERCIRKCGLLRYTLLPICVTWLVHTCDMIRSFVTIFDRIKGVSEDVGCCDTHSRLTWPGHTSDTKCSYVWYDSLARQVYQGKKKLLRYTLLCMCVIWLVHECDMTRSYVWHWLLHVCDTYTRLVHVCDMTRLYVWHDPFTCVIWLVYRCDMIRSYACHDSFICVTWLTHTRIITRSYSQFQMRWHRILRLFQKNFQFSTRRIRILMGFTISTMFITWY